MNVANQMSSSRRLSGDFLISKFIVVCHFDDNEKISWDAESCLRLIKYCKIIDSSKVYIYIYIYMIGGMDKFVGNYKTLNSCIMFGEK